MASVSSCPVLGYALTADAEVRAEEVELDSELRPAFRLVTPWGKENVHLAVHGVQQVSNALAAASAALWCGVPLEGVAGSLEQASGSPLRMEVRRPVNGPILLVDCYNANPASTEAALQSLAALPAARRVAVLGLMAELGAETAHQHEKMAALARGLDIEVHGYQTDLYGPAVLPDVDAAVRLLRSLSPEDAALLKGSRITRLEDVVHAYVAGNGGQSSAAGG
jgi:UDP-N-acetylmuramoyl-tripeptide--D-alanyl-D-alanine ligase